MAGFSPGASDGQLAGMVVSSAASVIMGVGMGARL
jgi:hypothetical protein